VFLLVIHALLPLANAAVIIAPQSVNARALGNNSMGVFDNFPSNGSRFQTLYASSLFPNSGPIYITQIAYRPKSPGAFNFSLPNYKMTLSTTTKNDDGLENTFANNVGTDASIVASGPIEFASQGVIDGISNFDIVFNLAKPFLYDPAKGNLLVDMQYFGPATGNVGQIDAVDYFNDGVSRVRSNPRISNCGSNVSSPTGCSLNGNGSDTSRAPVTQISYQLPSTVTVPALGATSVSARMGAFVELPSRPKGQRFQTLYASSLFGGASASPVWIRELAFRPAPGQPSFRLDIPDLVMSMSTTPLPDDNLTKTFSNNVGPNANVVLSGPIQLSSAGAPVAGGPGEFDLIFRLSKPFLYDPSQGSLLVDMQFSGQATGVGGYIDAVDGFGDGVSRVRTNGRSACGANDNNSPEGCSTEIDAGGNEVNISRGQVTRFLLQGLDLTDDLQNGITVDADINKKVYVQPIRADGSVPVTLIGTPKKAGKISIKINKYSMSSPPSSFGCSPKVSLEISPEVDFGPDTTVCISPEVLGASCSGKPTLRHWDGTRWNKVDSATNGLRGQICGIATSFSPYMISSDDRTVDISFSPIAPVQLEPGKKPSPVEIKVTYPNDLTMKFNTIDPSICTVDKDNNDKNYVAILQPGTCIIKAMVYYKDDPNNALQLSPEPMVSFDVIGVSQTITFPSITNKTLGASPFSPTVTSSSSLTVNLTSNTTGVCSVSGLNVTLLTLGTCTLQASQSGDAIYASAAQVTQTFTVTPVLLAQSITFETIPNTQVQSSISLSASASSGQAVTFSSLTPSVCTVTSGVVTLVAKGTCKVSADQAGNATYATAAQVTQTFTVTAVSQTITFPSITNKTLGASPFSPTVTSSSGLMVNLTSNTTGVCSVSGLNVTLLTLGTCTLQASQSGDAIFGAASSSQSFSVNAASVSGNNNGGDAPLPLWSYLLLALVLIGTTWRQQRIA